MNITAPLFLGVDVGTESVRCGLFDGSGKCLNIAVAANKTYIPHPGWAEQDPKQIWNSFQEVVRRCIQESAVEKSRIKAMAVTATSVTVLCVDEHSEPMGKAILWMDTRAKEEADRINETQHPVLRYVGGRVSPEWMLPKVLWLRNHRPEVYHKASHVVEIMDWLNFKLTGRWVLSMCTTSCEWNYSRPLGGWPIDLFEDLGVADVIGKWPSDMLYMGEPIGRLSRQTSEQLGLDEDTLVVTSGMDTYVAALGVGVLQAGTVAMVLGNSSCYLTLSEKEQDIPGIFGPIPDAFTPDMWAYQGGQTSAGSLIRWFGDTIVGGNGRRNSEGAVYQELDVLAQQVPAGAEGLIMLDTWQGERTPSVFPNARGALIGLSLKHTEGHMFRAFLEGVAYGARHIVDSFEESGMSIEVLHACGGGIRSKVWMQIYADVLRKPIYLSSTPHCSSLGSAICAASGFGYYKDLHEASRNMVSIAEKIYPENTEVYKFSYEKYLALKKNLKQHFWE